MAAIHDLLQMTYANIKSIPSRNVCQIVLECPLEEMKRVMDLLGAPNPKAEPWVAVARLSQATAEVKGGKLAQQAGIMCGEGAFRQWVEANDAEEAAQYIRNYCGVTTRRQLDHDDIAARKFLELKGNYEFWLRDDAA